jgi:hypothetical protein
MITAKKGIGRIIPISIMASIILTGCGNTTELEDTTKAVPEPEVQNTSEEDTITYDIPLMNELGIDAYCEKLGIKEYEYGSEFELTDDLKSTIENAFLCMGEFKSEDLIDDTEWKSTFVDRFLQNSWYTNEYLVNNISDDLMDKDQIEYVQYSLTGKYISFDEYANDKLDVSQASSGFNTATIIDYVTDIQGDTVTLVANMGLCEGIKEDYNSTYEVSVILYKNPYSCIDGYSIDSLSYKETTSYQEPDGKEHWVFGDFVDYNEEQQYLEFEYSYADDEINSERNFSHFFTVDISEHPEFYDFVKEHEDSDTYYSYEIAFIFDENNPAPFYMIKPSGIEAISL